jgi:Zn-dependent protease
MAFEWVLQVPILIFSIVIHEVSHGWTARWHGDDTAEHAGRLTLNPWPHADLFGTILFPALLAMGGAPVFGWAKPVPVDPRRLRGRFAWAKVSAAGPFSNIALAIVAGLGLRLVFAAGPALGEFQLTLFEACRFGMLVNLHLAAFNLVPVSPLDGSHVAEELLPRRWAVPYASHVPYGPLILLVLVFTRSLDAIVAPLLAALYIPLAFVGLLP